MSISPTTLPLPSDLARRTRWTRLGRPHADIPALICLPDWSPAVPQASAPAVVWIHGRTVTKELDPGRYLRWVRAGIAAVAIDLPGHGERADPSLQTPDRTLDVLRAVLPEIDTVVAALAHPVFHGLIDTTRLAIGGMSLGGMATLRRLSSHNPPHPFLCAAVEGTSGDLSAVLGTRGSLAQLPAEAYADLDPRRHLSDFRPIPLLALHSEADEIVPIAAQRTYLEHLRRNYAARGSDPELITLKTWPTTGAPQEHSGFGRVAHEAKTAQTDFFIRHLRPSPPATHPE